VFVTIYAIILLTGLASLNASESAYNGWLEAMTHPLALSFHLLALAAALYHTVTWFKVAPKVTPMMFIGNKKVPDIAITLVQYVIAIVLYLLLFMIVWRV
jgi:fumarate reductase subunit C